MTPLLVTVALAIGAALAVQAAANLQLAGALRSPVAASTLQLALAAGGLLGLAALGGSLAALHGVTDSTPWHLLGGLGSAVYVTAGILVVPRLGALGAVGLFISGQMLASLAIDALGLLGVERQPLGPAGLAGGLAVLAAAALIVRSAPGGPPVPRRPLWQAVALAAGAVLAAQGPVNARLRDDLDAPVAAGAFSFLVASAAMLAALAIWGLASDRRGRAVRGGHSASTRSANWQSVPWWGWLGAAVGAAYVTSVPLLIPEIGAAATIGLTVAGQQLASLAVDRYGLLRLPRRPLTRARMSAVAVLLAGVTAIQLA